MSTEVLAAIREPRENERDPLHHGQLPTRHGQSAPKGSVRERHTQRPGRGADGRESESASRTGALFAIGANSIGLPIPADAPLVFVHIGGTRRLHCRPLRLRHPELRWSIRLRRRLWRPIRRRVAWLWRVAWLRRVAWLWRVAWLLRRHTRLLRRRRSLSMLPVCRRRVACRGRVWPWPLVLCSRWRVVVKSRLGCGRTSGRRHARGRNGVAGPWRSVVVEGSRSRWRHGCAPRRCVVVVRRWWSARRCVVAVRRWSARRCIVVVRRWRSARRRVVAVRWRKAGSDARRPIIRRCRLVGWGGGSSRVRRVAS